MRKRRWTSLVLAVLTVLTVVMALSFAGCGTKKGSDIPYFGSGKTDYEGFTYLKQEILSLDEKKVIIYIPADEYAYVDEAYAGSEKLGVSVDVDIDPYLWDEEDYTLEENLEMEMEAQFDPEYASEYCMDAEVGDIVTNEDGTRASCTASYYSYDSYSESYSYLENTKILYQLDEGFFAIVNIDILSDAVSAKTEELLVELEQFYQVDIPWSNENAQAKVDAYVPSELPVSTDDVDDYWEEEGMSLQFDLPEGWEEVESLEGTYAPGGDMFFSGNMLQVAKEYSGEDLSYLSMIDFGSDQFRDFMHMLMGFSEDEEFTTSEAEIGLGRACRLDYRDNEGTKIEGYLIFAEDGYIHMIMGFSDERIDGAEEELQKCMEMVLETAEWV